MKVLSKSLAFLNYFGLCCTKRLREPTNEFMQYTVVSYIYFAVIGPLLPASALYVYRNLIDFAKSCSSLMVFSSTIAGIGIFLTIGLNMKKIKRVYIDIQAIVDKGNTRFVSDSCGDLPIFLNDL